MPKQRQQQLPTIHAQDAIVVRIPLYKCAIWIVTSKKTHFRKQDDAEQTDAHETDKKQVKSLQMTVSVGGAVLLEENFL